MKTRIAVISLLQIVIGSSVATAQDTRPFLGDWINVDAKTSEITRLKISEEKGKLKIRGWGECHPKECDWGDARLNLFRSHEDPRRFDYGFARWDFGFSDLNLVLHLDKNELLVDSYNVFKDESRRDCRSVATFKRTNDSRSVRGKSERDKLLNSLR
jgi:hypothetical protein